jgi:hypothetical protein
MLSNLWKDSAETVNFHRIFKIMGRQLENNPNSQYTLTYYIAKLLDNENTRLNANDFNKDLCKPADYNRLRITWNETLTANGFTSLL